MTTDELYADFKKNVYDKSEVIDPDEELMWDSLFMGYALAKGFTPSQAHDMTIYARYTLHIA